VAPGNRIVAASAAGSYLSTTYPERVVDGKGNGDYIELSGTSMSAAVVSGAAALLLEARPQLTPPQVKAALQLTSSRVADAGLIEEGAGSLNVAAAVTLVFNKNEALLPTTYIGGQPIICTGLAYGDAGVYSSNPVQSSILVWGNSQILVWGNAVPQTVVVWGGSVGADILVWGNNSVNADILVWGNTIQADILVWGNILVWGDTVNSDILVWGNRTDLDILVWGDSMSVLPD